VSRVERHGHATVSPRSASSHGSRLYRAAAAFAFLLLIIVGLGTVLLSPLLLSRLDALGGGDWARLSEIGQTYGAASAILAMVALGGVAASVLFQARQMKAGNIQTVRQFHFELIRKVLDDVDLYLPCWGPTGISTIEGQQRQLYANQVMNYLRMAYEIGAFTEQSFRSVLRNMFEGEVGRKFWIVARDTWVEISDSRRLRRFVQVVDEEYQKAVAAGPPAPADSINDAVQTPNNSSQSLGLSTRWRYKKDRRFEVGTLVGLIGGIAFGELLRRKGH
jgi:Family of unknown function (DUF6082)